MATTAPDASSTTMAMVHALMRGVQGRAQGPQQHVVLAQRPQQYNVGAGFSGASPASGSTVTAVGGSCGAIAAERCRFR